MLKSIINGINLLFSSLLLINSSTLFHQHEDMSQLSHTTIAIDALLCLGIYLMSLSLNISIGNHSRTYLLIAITSKLIEEWLQCIQMFFLGSLNLKLIINKKVNIFSYRLFVYHALWIILIERIFKFRTTNGLTINLHYYRVVRLCKSYIAYKEQSSKE